MYNTFKLAAVSSAALMILAAPAIAAGPTLKLGGYFDQKMSMQDQDDSAAQKEQLDVRTDTEIYFLGAATLDNGIKIKTRVELEGGTTDQTSTPDPGNRVQGNSATFDQIDEAFMTLSGSFGSVKIGMSDTAAKGMTTGLQGSWAANTGENLAFNALKHFVRPATVTARPTPAAQMDQASDGEQVSYTTPNMGGFQVAVGYAPNDLESFDGTVTDASVGETDIFDIGARYKGKLGGASVMFGGGMSTANNRGTAGQDDDSSWIVGGRAKMGMYQVSASYSRQEATKTGAVINVQEVNTIEAGIRAFMGATQYSIAYTRSEADSATVTVNGDEETVVVIGMRRKLGKGVSWHNSLWIYDAEDGDSAPVAGTVTSNDGYAVTTGIQLKF